MNSIPINFSCLTCGTLDSLKRAIIGVTISKEILDSMGIPLEEGEEVLICQECFYELCI